MIINEEESISFKKMFDSKKSLKEEGKMNVSILHLMLKKSYVTK